jgi:DNA repair exonuclease SbcCD ATPase subunit
MITFNKLKYKNFLSTGDNMTEIDLNYARSTLVVGQNGAGKSTMLDALSFALFGKAHRNITKSQLVNSINKKDCLVEVEFAVGPNNYRVVRGIKPNKFEIYKNKTLVNQESHNKEYQRVLEQNILKLNHKSFHQIVVLGSSSFIPFMQLPANHRREVIEDLLDINVFSKMNSILKERVSILKEQSRANQSELEVINEKIKTQSSYYEKLKSLASTQKTDKQRQISELEAKIEPLQIALIRVDENAKETTQEELNKLDKKIREIEKYEHQFKLKQRELAKELKFYDQNETCPTCTQGISQEFKEERTREAKAKFSEFEKGKEQAGETLSKLSEKQRAISNQLEDIQRQLNEQYQQQVQISEAQKQISKLQKEIEEAESETGSIVEAARALEELGNKKNVLVDEKSDIADKSAYNTVITEMLKDTGIKTKIIKQYLPVINNLTNKYLQILDFFVSFNLDDTFKESIRSRHRDEFSYDSFSEGEKQRIDLALLFTWRMVAKMKNSVATNLLILDETFDSSLDAEGVDNLTKILDTLDEDTNVFIISHKGELLDGKFEEKIEFVKSKNFSKIA